MRGAEVGARAEAKCWEAMETLCEVDMLRVVERDGDRLQEVDFWKQEIEITYRYQYQYRQYSCIAGSNEIP